MPEEEITLREDLKVSGLKLPDTHHNEVFNGTLEKGTVLIKDGDNIGINCYGNDSFRPVISGFYVNLSDGEELWQQALKQIEGIPIVPVYNSVLFSKDGDDLLYFHQYKHRAYDTATSLEIFQMQDAFTISHYKHFCVFEKEAIAQPFGRIQHVGMYIAIFSRMYTMEPITKQQFNELIKMINTVLSSHKKNIDTLIEKSTWDVCGKLFDNPIWGDKNIQIKQGISI